VKESPANQSQIIDIYRRRARGYDHSGLSSFKKWRKEAVQRLELKPGNIVVDLGCGTGLNFEPLQQAVGPGGKIIGVDLTGAMLDQARRRIAQHGWQNVELVQGDAARYDFPAPLDGVISTFALSFIPGRKDVILNGCKALGISRKWVVLDMAWPQGWPLWLQHLLFFLPRYAITPALVASRPWQTIWQTFEERLNKVDRRLFWGGSFYLISGSREE
jgi:ubiquinone/menaquinone biosynthesis C-methylase UbiE